MLLRASLVLLVAVALAAQQPYSAEKEAGLGASLAREVLQSTTQIESPTVRDYVQRVGGRLAVQLPSSPSYTFFVIGDDRGGPTHEPVWFPGGFILVPATLILTARNEAEFSGMLGHAMAHYAKRHGFRPATRSGEIPTWFVAGSDESLMPVGYRSIQRARETEADVLAVGMTSGAGYDPEALVRYIGRTQPVDSRESRVAAIESAIRDLPPKAYSAGSVDEFARVQDEVRRQMIR
jgi:predicted Zn-dependent protease